MRRALHALVAVALAALFAACGNDAPRFAPLPPGAAVLAFGDSVTWGTGAAEGHDYPTRLAQRTGWQIANAGVPGDLAQTARTRIDAELATHAPQLVLIEIGGNDFLRRRGHDEVAADVRAIVHRVRAAGAIPVLIAVPAFSPLGAATGTLRDAGFYREIAEEERVPLIDEVFADVLSTPALRTDPVHPNAEGYRRLADGIAAGLSRHGLLEGQ